MTIMMMMMMPTINLTELGSQHIANIVTQEQRMSVKMSQN